VQVYVLRLKPRESIYPNAYENDTKVQTLTSMVSLLKSNLEFCQEDNNSNRNPLYAEVGIPSYFYNNFTPNCSQDEACSWADAPESTKWTRVLTKEFSAAVYRAEFHRSASDTSDIESIHETAAETARVMPSGYVAISCINTSCTSICLPQDCTKDEIKSFIVLIVDISNSSLCLFADRIGKVDLFCTPWSTWPHLGDRKLAHTSDSEILGCCGPEG
jgi:hypothetical protein